MPTFYQRNFSCDAWRPALPVGMREHGRGSGWECRTESLCAWRIRKNRECAWYMRFSGIFGHDLSEVHRARSVKSCLSSICVHDEFQNWKHTPDTCNFLEFSTRLKRGAPKGPRFDGQSTSRFSHAKWISNRFLHTQRHVHCSPVAMLLINFSFD